MILVSYCKVSVFDNGQLVGYLKKGIVLANMSKANQQQIKALWALRLISPPSDRARVYGEIAKNELINNSYNQSLLTKVLSFSKEKHAGQQQG